MRIKIIRIAIIGLFLTIALDLAYTQVIRGKYFYNLSVNNRIRIVPLEGWRGRIMDRNGKILADSRTSYNVMVVPQDINNKTELFKFLSDTLNIEQKIIEGRYAKKKLAPFAPVVVAEDIHRGMAIILEESKYLYPSLIIQEGFKRSYPLRQNSAHVLGYVGKINRSRREMFKEYGYSPQSVIGYSGVEEYYDNYLKGGIGGVQVEVNSRGQQVRLLSLKEPTRGQDISITIDGDIQKLAMEALEGAKGAIVIMDMDNGDILGMTSNPAFDPNIFIDPNKQRQLSNLFVNKSAPLLNRSIQGLFPPGSVFKILVALGALDSQKITPHTKYTCDGYYKIGGRKFRCVHTHGLQNLRESLVHSCNVFYYRVGSILGADMIYRYARQFGLGLLTGIDLPYEESGNIPNRRKRFLQAKKRWYAGDTLNLSVGQGDTLTTPLQLTYMMALIANSGFAVQPHVIKSIGGVPVEQYHYKRNIDIDQNVFDAVQKGMRGAVTDYSGTANVLNLEQLYVAGKTGTAQTSGDKDDHAWFVGYVQKAKKNIAFCVFLEHGGSSHNACLVSRKLLLGMKEKELL